MYIYFTENMFIFFTGMYILMVFYFTETYICIYFSHILIPYKIEFWEVVGCCVWWLVVILQGFWARDGRKSFRFAFFAWVPYGVSDGV